MPRELLQYDIRHDQNEKDAGHIEKQLETHLRERFNVLLSTVEYGIKNGHLVRQGTEEPFIESIKRGRDVIQKIDSRTVDIERENAEVVGFEKIDSFLSNPATPLGAKMVSISPPGEEGSKYKHNFYDIFSLKEKNGKRYVELSRYSSGLIPDDYVGLLGARFRHPPQAHPIEFDISVTSEQIHKELHKEHEYMKNLEFEEGIWTSPLVQYCVQEYLINPNARFFNAILNAADEAWCNYKRRKNGQTYRDYLVQKPSYDEVRQLGKKEVRQAGGQCPGKSGADEENSPYSVSEFSRGYKFDRVGICVECKLGPKSLGPCKICEKCVIKIEKEELLN